MDEEGKLVSFGREARIHEILTYLNIEFPVPPMAVRPNYLNQEEQNLKRAVEEIVGKNGEIAAVARLDTPEAIEGYYKAFDSLYQQSLLDLQQVGIKADNATDTFEYMGKISKLELSIFIREAESYENDPEHYQPWIRSDQTPEQTAQLVIEQYNELTQEARAVLFKWQQYVGGHFELGIPVDAYLRAKLITKGDYDKLVKAEANKLTIKKYSFETRPKKSLDSMPESHHRHATTDFWVIYEQQHQSLITE